MSFFDIILSPFIFIIRQIFLLGYDVTQNYGFAIIFLSFGVNLLLLPVFIYIERVKRKDDVVKQKMKPLVDEIKRCYKGQERYYYLKTLNRQFNYSPLKALIPVLSLLLQIPFFIAAYQYLESFEPLNGVSFWFIEDLAKPDGLFGAVNFLPIAMTVVNLVTAYFYTRNGDTSERKQMVVVAAIFLVLLFNLPSGLVLYWTMNNVLSFFRLFITNPEVFRKNPERKLKRQQFYRGFRQRFTAINPKISGTIIFLFVLAILYQFNWAFQNNFNDIAQRFAFAVGGSILAAYVIAVLAALHKIEPGSAKGFKAYFFACWPAFRPTFFIIISIAILSQINWAMQFNFDDIVLRIILAVLAGIILTFIFALATLYFKDFITLKQKNFIFKYSELTPGYRAFFVLLAAVLIYTQLNWAQAFNFNDIVLRLSLVIFLSYLLVIVFANLFGANSRKSHLSVQKLKKEFVNSKGLFWIILISLSSIFIATQINWALQHSFDDIYFRVIAAFLLSIATTFAILFIIIVYKLFGKKIRSLTIPAQVFFSLVFLSLYFQLASVFYFEGTEKDFATIAFWLIIPAQLIGFVHFYKRKSDFAKLVFRGVLAMLIIVAGIQVYFIWLPQPATSLFESLQSLNWLVNANSTYSFINLGLIFSIILLPFYFKKRSKGNLVYRPAWLIYFFTILYLAGFVFLWNPMSIYSSYPDVFDFAAIDILKHNFLLFALSIVVLLAVYLILPKLLKYYWTVFVLALAIGGFFHNTLFPIDLGSLQENKFLHEQNLAQPLVKYILEALIFIVIIITVDWLLRKKYQKQIIFSMILLNSVLIFQSLKEASQTDSFLVKHKIIPETTPVISLSKDKQNIVYIIADMFHGWNINEILEQEPDLKKQLKGFTWYPNTITISSHTCGSISALLGGFDYSLDKLNEDESRNMQEKITQVTKEFYNKVKSSGYQFTGTKMMYSTIDLETFDTYIPKWHDGWNIYNSDLNIGLPRELGYTILWENAALYTAPLFLKPKIYNNGKWLHGNIEENLNVNKALPYNFLRLLPYISNAKNDEPNFVYLHNLASHHPWNIIDDNGRMQTDQRIFDNNKWVFKTILNWFKWMQDNDVYDNTKIVLISDHGPHWKAFEGDVDMNIPVTMNPSLKVTEDKIMEMFPLLMVKDFNEEGDLKEDWRFMCNADAPAILFDENDPTKGEPIEGREITVTNAYWSRKIWLEKTLRIKHKIVVKDNVYNLNNWEKIN